MSRYFTAFVIILLSIFVFFATQISRKPAGDNLLISFLDVGQGDAELIQKGDYQILIDGGPDDSLLPEIGKVMPPLDRKIEMVILSHPHADHLTGLNAVLDRYEIGEIISSGVVFSSGQYLTFLDKIKNKKIPFEVPTLGSNKTFTENGVITFLWPGDKFSGQTETNLNNTSLVTKVCYFADCALFMGDLEKDEQERMLTYYQNSNDLLKSAIIKVPHHGSNNALLPSLYEKVTPEYAVIEVGKDNQFGHPHQSTLDYLKEKSIQFFRTDQNGMVKFKLDKSGAFKL